MSKTELLFIKLRNISVLVSIGAFGLLIIDLLFAVLYDAIDCGNSAFMCTIKPEHQIFKSTLWTLLVLMVIFLVLARVLDIILHKEAKLVDVNEYRESLVKKEELSFSQTKIYSDMIKSKKSRYSDMSANGDEEDKFDEEEISIEPTPSLDSRKLSFFARKKLEESMREEELEELEKEIQDEEMAEAIVKQPFMEKIKNINWKFWAKENLEEPGEEIDKEPKTPFMEKVKNINWTFWVKEKSTESDESVEEETVDEEEKVQEPKTPFMEKVKSINWMFWAKEKSDKPSEVDEDSKKHVKTKKSVKTKGSKIVVSKTEATIKGESVIPDESVEVRAFYTRLNKGELIEIVAKATSLSKAKARLVINTMTKTITEQVKNDDEVRISKFGRFKKVTKDDENTVNFYPDKVFKDMITEDVGETADKFLLNKTAMKNMTETEVEEELYKEEKIHEHVDLKVVKEKTVKEKVVKEKTVVEKAAVEKAAVEKKTIVKEEPKIIEKPIIKDKPKVKEALKVEVKPAVEEKSVTQEKPEIKASISKPKKVKVKVATKTKADIIEDIFNEAGLSKNKSNKFLGTFSKVIIEQLTKGKDVELTGLGTMTTIVMPAKEAVNPQTKQKIIVPSHRQVRMRFSDNFKDKFS